MLQHRHWYIKKRTMKSARMCLTSQRVNEHLRDRLDPDWSVSAALERLDAALSDVRNLSRKTATIVGYNTAAELNSRCGGSFLKAAALT